MLRQALILSSQREYAQTLRQGLLQLDPNLKVAVETDPLRAMQLATQQYDLVLLDTLLDAMDGLQMLQFFKNQAPAAKFIVVSDTGDEAARALAYQNGADFFLERPRTSESLALALDAIRGFFKSPSAKGAPPGQTGSLAVNLIDIVQMHCLSGDSILLLVRSAEKSGDVFIFRGEIYHAQCPGKGGESAFRDMIRWNEGRVQIKSIQLRQAPPRTIETSYRELLDSAQKPDFESMEMAQESGNLLAVAAETVPDSTGLSVMEEAPPLENVPKIFFPDPNLSAAGDTRLPQLNSHWKVNLTGELLEGSQVAEPDRCAFITSFIYRKMADVAVALEVDYFNTMTLLGPHQQQVLVADNLGVRHGVFDTLWTNEALRSQYVKWCREQSL